MKKKIFTLLSLLGATFNMNAQVELGSAGNVFTQLNSNTHPLAVDPISRSILFIHRSDNVLFPSSNIARYRYDLSTDGGTTFSLNNGDLNPTANNVEISSRYPNAVISNPAAATNGADAAMTYIGVYHNNGDWDGANYGTAKLTNAPGSFTETVGLINNGDISLIYSMAEGATAAGKTTYWAIAEDETWTGASSPNTVNKQYVVLKGTLDHATNLVTWADNKVLPVPVQDENNIAMQTPNIAFDPTGQKGWISALADVRSDANPNADSVYSPLFWKTVDGGATWTGPYDVNLNDFQTLLDAYLPGNTPGNVTAPATVGTNVFHAISAGFDSDLGVDQLGRPHMLIPIGFGSSEADYAAGTGYTIRASNFVDVSYDETINRFTTHFVAGLEQYRDTVGASTTTPFVAVQANRPQVGFNKQTSTMWFSFVDGNDSIFDVKDRYHFVRGMNTVDYTGTPLMMMGIDSFYYHSIAPKLMTNVAGDSVIVSAVYSDLNADNNIESVAKFIYAPMTVEANTTVALQSDTCGFDAQVIIPIGIKDINIIGATVSPNPAINVLNIKDLKASQSKVQIIDLTGKIISTEYVKGNNATINIQNLVAGTYVIHVKNEAGRMIQKFNKQ
jgi:hypothetical protein